MKETKIALRYAKALFELAEEQNILEQVKNDMDLVSNVCKSSKDFRRMLLNPIIKFEKKEAIIKEIFGNRLHKISLSFLLIIARKRREVFIDQIAEQFIVLYKKHKDIKTVVFETAVKTGDETNKKIIDIIKKYTHSEIELVEEINKDLIGGFKLTFDNKQYDASILSKLQKLTREFNVNYYEKGL